MRHKYISKQSYQLLSFLNEKDKKCFGLSEAANALPMSGAGAIKQLLSDMTKRGLLMRLKNGLYYVIPYEQDAKSFMPDWHLIAECLVSNADHYIGYYSALQIHNLIIQPSLKEQVVVSKQIRPSSLLLVENLISIRGMDCQ